MGFFNRFRDSQPNATSSPHFPQRTSQDPVLPQTSHSNISPSTSRENGLGDSHGLHTNQHLDAETEKPPHGGSSIPHPVAEGYSRNSEPWANRPADEEMGHGTDFGNSGIASGNGEAPPRDSRMEPTIAEEGNARKPNFLGKMLDRIFKFRGNDPYGPRPSFKTYLKMYWSDWVTLLLLAMFALGLLLWSPLPRHKYFAVTFNTNTNEIVNPQFAYPKQKQYLSIAVDAAIAIGTPILVAFIVNTATVHSFWDMNCVVLGVAYSVMTACMIQIIIKLVWVGLRPHFLTVCNPKIPPVKETDLSHSTDGVGFMSMYYTVDVCTEKDPKKLALAMQSFPSGHSAAAWAGLLYLSLYLNGKLKPFANYHPAWWKLLAFVAPQVAAVLICASLTLDNSHNWYDILVGALIGVAMAFCAYRMTFASIWDWRWNHIPLPRGNVLNYYDSAHGWSYRKREGKGLVYNMADIDRWEGFVATRRGGWRPGSMGIERRQVYRGAPGDMTATAMLYGDNGVGFAGAGRTRMGNNTNLNGGLRNPNSTWNPNYSGLEGRL